MSTKLKLSKLISNNYYTNYNLISKNILIISSIFIFSPLSWYFLQGYFTNIIIGKITCTLGSLGLGWGVGNNMNKIDKNIWNLIFDNIEIEKELGTYNKHKIEKILDLLNDQDTDIGCLYQFIVLLLIEKYEDINKSKINNYLDIIDEINLASKLLTIKHPFYPNLLNFNDIYNIINEKLTNDLDNYIKFFYLIKDIKNTETLYSSLYNFPKKKIIYFFIDKHPNLNLTIIEIESILKVTEVKLENYLLCNNINLKSEILKNTFTSINNEYLRLKNKNLSCDELLPILTIVVIYNWEKLPPSEISQYYQYKQNCIDEYGYISTVIQNASNLSLELLKTFNNSKIKFII